VRSSGQDRAHAHCVWRDIGVTVMQSLVMVEPAVIVGNLPRRLFAAVRLDSAIPIPDGVVRI
jgi:hypothetical protein